MASFMRKLNVTWRVADQHSTLIVISDEIKR